MNPGITMEMGELYGSDEFAHPNCITLALNLFLSTGL